MLVQFFFNKQFFLLSHSLDIYSYYKYLQLIFNQSITVEALLSADIFTHSLLGTNWLRIFDVIYIYW